MKRSTSAASEKAWSLVSDLQSFFASSISEGLGLENQFSQRISWLRDEGVHGGGNRLMAAADSECFNRASINVSQVHYEDDESRRLNSATALSTIIHPKHPLWPSVHMHYSLTEMKSGEKYWRLMADLNPSIPDENDKDTFFQALRSVAEETFEEGIAQGNRYFHIPSLHRHRGVAHFYLEQYFSDSFDQDVNFTQNFAKHMMNVYGRTILERHRKSDKPITDRERAAQIAYHTTYFLQVLTLDRGTTSGLMVHNQNDVGTLGSLPSHIDVELLRSWVPRLPSIQRPLLERLILDCSKTNEGIAFISDDLKASLANTIRQFYREFPAALDIQARGNIIPTVTANHKPEAKIS
ncbi:MAG: coproporphyrinogen III oxidase [Pseudobacteriovorax sp.]|nr:coproporphyrinogen III oxidase [Pseudobacteriovorax sp.]